MRPWTVYPTDTNRPNVKVNDAGGDILIIGGIHGDEPSSWKAIIDFYRENYKSVTRPITFLFANPRAAQRKRRYIESDLNREFGSQYNPDKDTYEAQLAKQFQPIVAHFDIVLALHATQSTNEPFGIFGPPVSKNVLRLLYRVGVSKAVYTSRQKQHGSLIEYPNVLEIECGFQFSESAIDTAKQMITEAVSFIDGLETHSPRPQNDVRIFELTEQLPKPHSEMTLHVKNFQTVKKGSLVAESPGTKYFAPDDFAPILMSENGYENVLGYRGIDKGWLSTAKLYTHSNQPDIITRLEF